MKKAFPISICLLYYSHITCFAMLGQYHSEREYLLDASITQYFHQPYQNYKLEDVRGSSYGVFAAYEKEDVIADSNILVRDPNDDLGYVVLHQGDFKSQLTQEYAIYEIGYDYDLEGGSVTMPKGCVLKFVGGSIANGTIISSDTNIYSGSQKPIFRNIVLSGTFLSNCAYADWFDDVDDTRLLKSLTKISGKLVFSHNKKYKISSTLTVKPGTVIDMNGASIIMSQSNQQGFRIGYVKNVEIYGGSIIGHRIGGNPDELSGEFGIWILDSENVNIHDVYINNFTRDGIYISYGWNAQVDENHIQNIVISRCVIDAVGRNGVAVTSGDNVVIEDCIFKNINAFYPKAGIDIEPETGVANKKLHIDNIRINNCKVYNCEVSVQVESSNCNYDEGSVYINNLFVETNGEIMIDNVKRNGGLNTFISNVTMVDPYWHPIYIINPCKDRIVSIDNIHLSGYNERRSRPKDYQGAFGVVSIFAQKKVHGGSARDDLGSVYISNLFLDAKERDDLYDNIVSIGYNSTVYDNSNARVYAPLPIVDVNVKGIYASQRQIRATGYCSFIYTVKESRYNVSPNMIKYLSHGNKDNNGWRIIALIQGEATTCFEFKVQCLYINSLPQFFSGRVVIHDYQNSTSAIIISNSIGATQIDEVRVLKIDGLYYLAFHNATNNYIDYIVSFDSFGGDNVMPIRGVEYNDSYPIISYASVVE